MGKHIKVSFAIYALLGWGTANGVAQAESLPMNGDKCAECKIVSVEAPINTGQREARVVSSRTRQEIDSVVDSNKDALKQIYQFGLRENPALMGKIVFNLMIEPEGNVSDVSVQYSEIKDTLLVERLASSVKAFKFEDRDVERITVTLPIGFIPSPSPD